MPGSGVDHLIPKTIESVSSIRLGEWRTTSRVRDAHLTLFNGTIWVRRWYKFHGGFLKYAKKQSADSSEFYENAMAMAIQISFA